MKPPLTRLVSVFACAALLAACAKSMGSDVYTDSGAAGKVLEGTVIHVRAVTIKAHEQLGQNTTGGLVGAGAGGIAGSEVGQGRGSLAGALGGAVIGAVAGALAEDALSTSHGSEYLVRIDKKYLQQYHSIKKKISVSSKSGIEQGVAASASVDTKTDLVSVVQATDASLHKGSRVYIIYNDNRPRLEAEE